MKNKNNKNKRKKIVSQVLLGSMVMGIGTEVLTVMDNSVFNIKANALEGLSEINNENTGIKKIVSGSNHTFYLKTDGTVLASGKNTNHQIDAGYTTNVKDVPTKMTIGNVKDIFCGSNYTMFLKEDGSVWVIGSNRSGQLGDYHEFDITSLSKIDETNIEKIYPGSNTTFFAKKDGSLWVCGSNDYGQYGNGRSTSISTPIKAFDEQFKDVVSSSTFSVFLKEDGTVWATGSNEYGQIANPSTFNYTRNKFKVDIDDVKGVAVGYYYTMFVKNDGTVWATGSNAYGQLGIGDKVNKNVPTQVDITGVKEVVCKDYTTYFVKYDGTVWACGSGTNSTVPIKTFITNAETITKNNVITKKDGTICSFTDILSEATVTPFSSNLFNLTNYTLDKIYSSLLDNKKYGSLATTTSGKSKYNNTSLGYVSETTSKLSSVKLDDSQYKINATLPNGACVLIDNYGSVQYFSDLSKNPINITVDGTTVKDVELGMLDQTPIVMLYKYDGTIWYFNPTETSTPVKILTISQNEMTETSMYQEKNAVAKYFLFQKKNGDLVYYDINRFEKSIDINMNNVKEVIPATSNNSTLYVMKDGTLKDATKTIELPEGLTVSEVVSNRFLKLSDGFVYSINDNKLTSAGILYNAVKSVVNNVVWMNNGTVQSLTDKGTMKSESSVNGNLIQKLVAFDENNTYVLNKDKSTYGIGNLIATTDLLTLGIDCEQIATFISNSSSSVSNKLIIMKDGTVYTNPALWTKSSQLFLTSDAVSEIDEDIMLQGDALTIATKAVTKAEGSKVQSDLNDAQLKVTALDESEEKTALQLRIDTLQTLINDIKDATDLVVKAEGSKLQEDVTTALEKVNLLEACNQKTVLANRLVAVQKIIDNKIKIQEATVLVEKAEESKTQLDVTTALEKVNSLDNCDEKTSLKSRLQIVQKEINNVANLVKATQAVEKAEESKLQEDLNSANVLIEGLLDNGEKTALQQRINTLQALITKIKEATDLVVIAEGSKLQTDLDNAQGKVTALDEGTEKTALQQRIDTLQALITKIKEATDLVTKAESSKLQNDLNEAQLKVTALDEGTEKTLLENRLVALQKVIDNNVKIQEATELVVKAEGSKTQLDVTTALNKVNELDDCGEKTSLKNRLEIVQKEIDNVAKVVIATQAVVKAEGSKLQLDLNSAKELVEDLLENGEKTALQERIRTLQILINKIKEATDLVVKAEGSKLQLDLDNAQLKVTALDEGTEKTALQERINILQALITKIKEATDLVVIAEGSKLQTDLNDAQSKVTALDEGTQKTALQERINTLQALITKIKEATDLVVIAESSKTQSDVNTALEKVNKLQQSSEKTDLLGRLDVVQEYINEHDDTQNKIKEATELVVKAENSKLQLDVTNAFEKVNDLPFGGDRTALEERLNAVQTLINKIKEAIELVEKAESSKKQLDVTVALQKVNKLEESSQKTDLLERLALVQQAIDENTKLQQATDLVAKAEETKAQLDISKAQSAINLLPVSEDKTALQERLDLVKEQAIKEEETNQYNKLLQDATNKVIKAESTKSDTDILGAQLLINNLKPQDKEPLQERLDALKKQIEEQKAQDAYDKQLANAIAKVEKAESTKTDVDIRVAETLIANLKESDRPALQERIDSLKEQIKKEQEDAKYAKLLEDATLKVTKAESTKSNYDITVAQMAIDKLKAEDKPALQLRLDNLNQQIKEEEEQAKYDKLLQDATAKVEKAENTKTNYDIKVAKDAIDKLNPEDKTPLQLRITLLEYNILLEDANNKVNNAVSLRTDNAIAIAQSAIDKLPNQAPIQEVSGFKYIISSLMRAIDSINPFSSVLLNKTELQQKIDELKLSIEEEKYTKLVADATELVSKAELSKLTKDIQVAQSAIDKLKEDDKTSLQARLDALKLLIEQEAYAKIVEEVTALVIKAEESKLTKDVTVAQNSLSKLKEADKEPLQARLNALKLLIEEEAKEAQLLKTATTKVEQAEKMKTQKYIDDAKLAVDKLKPSQAKTELLGRIEAIEQTLTDNNTKNLIAKAEVYVKQAEALKREPYIGKAQTAIDLIGECEEKTLLQARLDKLKK